MKRDRRRDGQEGMKREGGGRDNRGLRRRWKEEGGTRGNEEREIGGNEEGDSGKIMYTYICTRYMYDRRRGGMKEGVEEGRGKRWY